MIRRWSDTVYAGYVDDGGWFGRFVGCGSLAEAVSYVEAAAAGHKTRRRNARTSHPGARIKGVRRAETTRRTRPNILTKPGSEAS